MRALVCNEIDDFLIYLLRIKHNIFAKTSEFIHFLLRFKPIQFNLFPRNKNNFIHYPRIFFHWFEHFLH